MNIPLNLHVVHGRCQYSCPFCLYPFFAPAGKAFTMPRQVISQFIAMNKDRANLYEISFIPAGEPLLNPEIYTIIQDLVDAKFRLNNLSTNLAFDISVENLKLLCSSFDQISVNFTVSQVSEATRQKVLDNLRQMKNILQTSDARARIVLCRVQNPNDPGFDIPQDLQSLPTVPVPMVVYESHYFQQAIGSLDTYSAYTSQLQIDPDNFVETETMAKGSSIANPQCGPNLALLPNGNYTPCNMADPTESEKVLGTVDTPLFNLLQSSQFLDLAGKQQRKEWPKCQKCPTCGTIENARNILNAISQYSPF